ncbi:MAG: MFS transporter [Kineosporiaceae bacterium]
MYVTVRDAGGGAAVADGRATPVGRASRVATTVLLLGVVSMLTDVSSESVAAVLPLYVTVVLGLSPFAYGVVDALYVGVSGAVRLLGGWLSDRVDRPKWVAFSGYALSAVSRAALLPAAGFAALVGVVTADRIGKGIRTAPRDALITAASPPAALGRAFGVHRALDTLGAFIGPLLAFAILAAIPLGFDVVFVVSFAVAVLGVAVLGLLVPDIRRRDVTTDATPDSPRELAPAFAPTPARGNSSAAAAVPARPRLRDLAVPGFGRLLLAAGVLGLLTVGDGFLYLVLQRRDGLAAEYFPLLYVGTSVTYLLLAVPLGRLADRVGRTRVFLAGHVVLLLAYLAAGGPVGGTAMTVTALLLLGVYYAATDGVVSAIAGQLAPAHLRATGIAAVQTAVVAGRAGASLLFGLAWALTARDVAVLAFAGGLVVAIAVAAVLLRGVTTAPGPASGGPA